MRTRRKFLNIGAVSAICIVAGILTYVYLLPNYVFVPMRFDSEEWKTTPSEFSHSSIRLRMADSFLKREHPIGKTRAQIVALLGEPNDTPYFADYDMVYHLGAERGFMAIDSEWLVMKLDDDGRVTDADLVTD